MTDVRGIWEIILFFLGISILAISPGFVLLSLIKINLNRFEKLVLSLGVGITIADSIYFFCGLLKIQYLPDILIGIFFIISIYFVIKNKTNFQIKIRFNSELISLIIILILSLFQSSIISGGGYNSKNGTITFPQTGDAMWIMSLSRELSKNIPPIHPGFATDIVTNYHYFTHLFIGLTFRFTKISVINLYFNYFSLFYSLLLGLSAYILGRKIFKKIFLANVLTIITYSAGSFSYLLPLWLGKNFNWNEGNFWISQTFGIILNPAVMLSLSLFYLVIFCVYKLWEEKDKKIIIPLILLSGTLISFKVYAGLIILGSFALISLFDLFKNNNLSFKVFIGMMLLSLLVFLPVSGKDSTSFMVYAPFWYLHTMVENADRLNIPDWALKEQYYWATNNIFAVVRLRLMELFLFIIGNLGIRIIGFLLLPILFIKKISISRFISFIFIGFITGMVIPLFFIQEGSVGNTTQFFYYSLILGNILTVLVLKNFFEKNRIAIIALSLLIIVFSAPTVIRAFNSKNKTIMDKNLVSSLFALKKVTKPGDIILLPLTSPNIQSMYVSVVSERNTFYSHKLMAENTLKNYKLREKELQEFFYPENKKIGKVFQKEFIMKYNLSTLYLLREELDYQKKIYIPYKIIFKNNSAEIIKFL